MYASDEDSTPDDRQRWSPANDNGLVGRDETAQGKRLLTGSFLRLLATNMTFGFSISVFYLLPKHLTVDYAATPGTIGAVMGIFGLTCVVLVPWIGRWTNALGLPRTIALSLLVMALASLGFALVHDLGPAMYVLRVLQGLATAGFMTAALALVCELAPAARLGQAMGLAGAASLIMNAVAPAVAEPLATHWGFSSVFALAGFVALVGAVLARRLPAQASLPQPDSTPSVPSNARRVLGVLALTGAGFNVVMAFIAPLALSRGTSAVRGFFVSYTLAALAVRLFGTRFTDRLGLRTTAVVSLLLYGAAIAAVAMVGPRSIVALGLAFGLAHGALFPTLMALLFQNAEPEVRSQLAGFSNGVLNLGMLMVLGFGQMANHMGLVPVFVLSGLMVMSSVALLTRKSSTNEARATL
jgi:MFS family permease